MSDEINHRFKTLSNQIFRFEQNVFRACKPRYLRENPQEAINGMGSSKYGGRWNLPRRKVVYASLDYQTCLEESVQWTKRTGQDPGKALPITMFSINMQLTRCLSLTQCDWFEDFGTAFEVMSQEDWVGSLNGSLTQRHR